MDEQEKSKNQQLIENAYRGYNSRDVNAVLSLMHQDIHWPKAFEGGYVIGHEAVREYWDRQWSEINPNVDPVGFRARENGTFEVEVHQLVKDLKGTILFNGIVKHVYVIKGGLLQHMDIELNDQ